MRSIKFVDVQDFNGLKRAKLTELDIEYSEEYVRMTVPCESHLDITVEPKTEMNYYAASSIMKGVFKTNDND